MCIAVSKDEGETEEVLTKKLFIFSRIFTMLYGPVDYKYIHWRGREKEGGRDEREREDLYFISHVHVHVD